MNIKSITESDIQDIAQLACQCFVDDPFYIGVHPDREQRKSELEKIFTGSIRICMEYGHAYYHEAEGQPIAFALWFNYNRLKLQNTTYYKHLFPTEGGSLMSSAIKKELDEIEALLNESTEYLYLLAIGVGDGYRRQGIAKQLVSSVKEAYPQYSLFADISNRKSVELYRKLNFEIIGEHEQCIFVRHRSNQGEYSLSKDQPIFIAIPQQLPTELFINRNIPSKSITLNYIQSTTDSHPIFKQSLYHSTKAKLISVDYDELLAYQRYINILNFNEITVKIGQQKILIYVSNTEEYKHQAISASIEQTILRKSYEWAFIPDTYLSIPVAYQNVNKLIQAHLLHDNFMINRLLSSLDFRTTYEAGIPVRGLDNRNFKYRISRYYLGPITIQIQAEKEISFNGSDQSTSESIGSPVEMGLVIAIDQMTQCGVLHLISLSCGLLITQLLDSSSRNQLNIKNKNETENLYEYLKREFDIEKKGSAKAFITTTRKREEIRDDMLASMLFCETLYEEGEALGKVVDTEIRRKLETENGMAQYNYATVFAHTNILIQISETLAGNLTERIIKESITLFYIELILFEEAAIHIANDQIVRFLTSLNKFSPNTVLKNINFIITDHMRTIEFWDIQMNYPSSKKSVDDIRKAFKLRKEQETIERNKTQLLTIYQIRSDIVDRTEASILSAAGIILTVISVTDLITDASKSPVLAVIALLVGILLLTKRFIFQKMLTKRRISR